MPAGPKQSGRQEPCSHYVSRLRFVIWLYLQMRPHSSRDDVRARKKLRPRRVGKVSKPLFGLSRAVPGTPLTAALSTDACFLQRPPPHADPPPRPPSASPHWLYLKVTFAQAHAEVLFRTQSGGQRSFSVLPGSATVMNSRSVPVAQPVMFFKSSLKTVFASKTVLASVPLP